MSSIDVKSGPWKGFFTQYHKRYMFTINLQFENDTVTGSGNDEIGSFSINGTFNRENGKIKFSKVYQSARFIKYSGVIAPNGLTITGKYTVKGNDGNVFTMSFDTCAYIDAKSGHWIGYYLQYRKRHVFSMNLKFETNTLTGSGDDAIGTFYVEGLFDRITGKVDFIKVYHGAHSVKYSGEVAKDGCTMLGKYSVGGVGDDFTMSFDTCSYIDAKSGHWIGYYMQYRDRHVFSMNLKFETNTLTGSGGDAIGTFYVEGTFDRITGKVDFIKVYHGAHSVKYSGEVAKDGCTMFGKYSVGGVGDDFTMSVNTWW